MSAVGKPKIVLLGQKDPTKEVELSPDEGLFESWLAVAQDMWGYSNLTPYDGPFASRAIGTIVPTVGGNFGVLTYQLGFRLFTFSREGGIWIDAFEAEPTLSKLEKRPKDKIKLATWEAGQGMLNKKKFTHLALLSPSRLSGNIKNIIAETTPAVKRDGQVFLADMMAGPNATGASHFKYTPDDYKGWMEAAGYKFYSEVDITSDIRIGLLRGLHNSLNMVANIRNLKEPWRALRMRAFEHELESVVGLHMELERGEAIATGLYYTKE